MVNKQPSDFWFHQVLRCFRVVWSQFWTSSNFLSALESTTNNQEVKRIQAILLLGNTERITMKSTKICIGLSTELIMWIDHRTEIEIGFQSLHGGQFTLPLYGDEPMQIFVYHSPTDAAPQFLQKLIPFTMKSSLSRSSRYTLRRPPSQ